MEFSINYTFADTKSGLFACDECAEDEYKLVLVLILIGSTEALLIPVVGRVDISAIEMKSVYLTTKVDLKLGVILVLYTYPILINQPGTSI